jgi:hypothetical protein
VAPRQGTRLAASMTAKRQCWHYRPIKITIIALVATALSIALLSIVRSFDDVVLDHHYQQQQHGTASALAFLFNSSRTPLPSFETHAIDNNDRDYGTATTPMVAAVPVAQTVADMNILSSYDNTFCVPWNVVSDEWWTHHVEWAVFFEDDTHYCFDRILDDEKRAFLSSLYRLQFPSSHNNNNNNNNCSNVLMKDMWSSGFSADMNNVVDGLMRGMETRRPFQVTSRQPWHYALAKQHRRSSTMALAAASTCPTRDMFCYFLPISSCPQQVPPTNDNGTVVQNEIFYPRLAFGDDGTASSRKSRWYWEYATRLQTWMCKSVYDYTQHQIRTALPLQTPCTVMHVRRGDVVLHGTSARRYHAIRDYINVTIVNASSSPSHQYKLERNILLLTDDDNAIHEALTEFPNDTLHHWMYLNRTRYKAASGGWEQHLPSRNATLEMTILLSTLRLVRHCNSLIKSSSGFGKLILQEMRAANASVWFVNVEDGYTTNSAAAATTTTTTTTFSNLNNNIHSVIFNAKNAQTVGISKPYIRAPPPPAAAATAK